MKKRNYGKAAAAAALCVVVFGATGAIAGGRVHLITSSSSPLTEIREYEDMQSVEADAGFTAEIPKAFSNGYVFVSGNTTKNNGLDESGTKVASWKEITADYTIDGSQRVSLFVERAEDYVWDGREEHATEIREADGIRIIGNIDEYLMYPKEEDVTDEERAREAADPHFFISIGSSERETFFYKGVVFDKDGLGYHLMSNDDSVTLDTLFEMAKDLIAGGFEDAPVEETEESGVVTYEKDGYYYVISEEGD